MEELLLQLDISPELSDDEIQRALEKQEVDISRKISVVNDSDKRAELEQQLKLIEDALIMVQDKLREQRKKEQEQRKKEQEEKARQEKLEQEAREKEEAKKRQESGLKQYKEEVPEFSVDSIYDQYESAVKQRDMETMRRLYAETSREAESGNGRAMNLLALLYILENGVEHSVKSVRLMKAAAEMGNSAAYNNLGFVCKKGKAMEFNAEQAREYLIKASELGNETATRKLAEYYEDGEETLGISTDLQESSIYYGKILEKMEADVSDDKYRRTLYRYVRNGWSEKSSKQGGAEAQAALKPLFENEGKYTQEAYLLLGDIYVRESKYNEAVGQFLKAGTNGVQRITNIFPHMPDDEKRDNLDVRLENMTLDEENYTTSFRGELLDWYGERYRKGVAKTKDHVQAFKYYTKAMELGNKNGAKHREALVNDYLNNDSFEALAFFQEAAEKGNPDAYKYLGDMYAEGRGCARNYEKAMEYYTYAKRGTFGATCEVLIEKMKRLEKCKKLFEQASAAFSTDNYEMAIAKLEQLAETDKYPDARYFLARLMENGHLHYRQNQSKALQYYNYAAEDGHRDAQRKMVEIYRNGLLGARMDRSKAAYWEGRLKK